MSAQLDALRAFVAGRPAGTAPAPVTGPQIVVVGSGKGGTGTSVVAALVAIASAAAGRRVLLVDADPHVGALHRLLGTTPRAAVADLALGVPLDALATPVSATLTLVAGGPASSGVAVDPAEHRALLRRVAGLYAGHDLIVVDGGSRLDTVCACCESGGLPARLLVVTGAEPIALAASYALLKAARERTAVVPGGPVLCEIVINRHDDDAAQLAFAQIADACREFLGATTLLAGVLPDDTSLSVALRAGMSLQDAASGSPAAIAAHDLAQRLLDALGTERRMTPGAGATRPTRSIPASYAPPLPPALLGAIR